MNIRNLVDGPNFGFGENLRGKVKLVLAELPYSVQRGCRNYQSKYDVFGWNYVMGMAKTEK